jgi:NADPH:quinone reductase-like Zn-dependent oxidoreductase
MKSFRYAAYDKKSPLAPFRFERREPKPNDVAVEITYCGICHSDIHQVRDEWGGSIYPMVPGHEIVGHVTYGVVLQPTLPPKDADSSVYLDSLALAEVEFKTSGINARLASLE